MANPWTDPPSFWRIFGICFAFAALAFLVFWVSKAACKVFSTVLVDVAADHDVIPCARSMARQYETISPLLGPSDLSAHSAMASSLVSGTRWGGAA